ncbi:MAG TPA: hypothetical protein VGL86_23835 [Polyangia bacterium]
MLGRDDVMPLFLLACPSFGEPWAAYRRDATYVPGMLYLDLAELVRHVLALEISGGADGELARVFAIVERLHVEGDAVVREAATIGFLEGLQNNAEHAGIDAQRFERRLGPESTKWWYELARFWSGEVPFVGAGLTGKPPHRE